MFLWTVWRNPIAVFAVVAVLAVASYATFAAASEVNEAADGQMEIGAVAKAAADLELAWFQAMGADALAATGQAPDEAQGFYDGAINLYNSSKVVLSAAGIDEVNQALAGSDQALVVMNQAFEVTKQLAANGDVVGATRNHMDNTVVLYSNVEPAVKGLAQIAQAGDARLEARLDNGATDLRIFGWISAVVAAMGAAFAGWTAWSIYRRDDDPAISVSDASGESESMDQAA